MAKVLALITTAACTSWALLLLLLTIAHAVRVSVGVATVHVEVISPLSLLVLATSSIVEAASISIIVVRLILIAVVARGLTSHRARSVLSSLFMSLSLLVLLNQVHNSRLGFRTALKFAN